MRKQRFKLKPSEMAKIQRRYHMKYEEFEAKPLEELRTIYNTKKMSSTDRYALEMVTAKKLEDEAVIKAEIVNNNPNVDGSSEGEE